MTNDVNKRALEMFVAQVKNKAKEKLKSSGRGIWKGKMIDSISGSVEYDDGDWQFFFDYEDYLEFIDEGVNGTERSNGSRFSYTRKKPPIDKISPWAKSKGLNPFAVQNSIFKKGIKGIHFFEKSIDEELEKMLDYILEASIDISLNDNLND